VTAVGHAQTAQYPPRRAAPVQGVWSLVEAVAAPLVGAGPASSRVRLHHHYWPSRPGRRGRSGQTGQPRSYDYNRILVLFSHADMTPPATIL